MDFLIPLVFIPFFILLWIGVTGLISVISGWRALANTNPVPAAMHEIGENYSFQSLRLGFVGNYNSSVIITVYIKGIRIAPVFFLSFFHKPIYIGYDAMSDVTFGRFIRHYMTFKLADRKIMIIGKGVLKIRERMGTGVR
ncbi:MAG: hypothetical protein JW807_07805 [Spirochaetes bacterium]|nr:hypothetical protein [Spirochaetota bacterium]